MSPTNTILLFLCVVLQSVRAEPQVPVCGVEGMFMDVFPGDCKKFYSCQRGFLTVESCGFLMDFDPQSLDCKFQWMVDCSLPSIRTTVAPLTTSPSPTGQGPGTLICRVGDSFRDVYPGNCQQFYDCKDGDLIVGTCGFFRRFDPTTLSCLWLWAVDCDAPSSRTTTPPPTTPLPLTSQKKTSKVTTPTSDTTVTLSTRGHRFTTTPQSANSPSPATFQPLSSTLITTSQATSFEPTNNAPSSDQMSTTSTPTPLHSTHETTSDASTDTSPTHLSDSTTQHSSLQQSTLLTTSLIPEDLPQTETTHSNPTVTDLYGSASPSSIPSTVTLSSGTMANSQPEDISSNHTSSGPWNQSHTTPTPMSTENSSEIELSLEPSSLTPTPINAQTHTNTLELTTDSSITTTTQKDESGTTEVIAKVSSTLADESTSTTSMPSTIQTTAYTSSESETQEPSHSTGASPTIWTTRETETHLSTASPWSDISQETSTIVQTIAQTDIPSSTTDSSPVNNQSEDRETQTSTTSWETSPPQETIDPYTTVFTETHPSTETTITEGHFETTITEDAPQETTNESKGTTTHTISTLPSSTDQYMSESTLDEVGIDESSSPTESTPGKSTMTDSSEEWTQTNGPHTPSTMATSTETPSAGTTLTFPPSTETESREEERTTLTPPTTLNLTPTNTLVTLYPRVTAATPNTTHHRPLSTLHDEEPTTSGTISPSEVEAMPNGASSMTRLTHSTETQNAESSGKLMNPTTALGPQLTEVSTEASTQYSDLSEESIEQTTENSSANVRSEGEEFTDRDLETVTPTGGTTPESSASTETGDDASTTGTTEQANVSTATSHLDQTSVEPGKDISTTKVDHWTNQEGNSGTITSAQFMADTSEERATTKATNDRTTPNVTESGRSSTTTRATEVSRGIDSTTPGPPLCQPGRPLLPFPGECTLFIMCARGAPIPMRCPPGLHFNPKVMSCDWPWALSPSCQNN